MSRTLVGCLIGGCLLGGAHVQAWGQDLDLRSAMPTREDATADPRDATSASGALGAPGSAPPEARPATKQNSTLEAPATVAEQAASNDPSAPVEQSATGESAPTPEPALTAEQVALRDRIRRCLAYYFFRPETTDQRSPWGVMHAIISFGVDTSLLGGNRQVNAVAWLCANGPCNGMQLLTFANGSVAAREGPGYQGHAGQMLAILAQSRVKIDYPLVVSGRRLSIADLVRSEQTTCRPGTELTFKLIGLSHYLDSDATWQNDLGQTWSISRLIREELAQPIVGATCGGTHRLTGFVYAVRERQYHGRPVDGQWERAQDYLERFHAYTFKLQNADGSFSTEWFARRGDAQDLDLRLETSGHTLEWLACSMARDQLADPRLVRAVEYVTDLMWRYRGRTWDIGAKGHALHALALYDERAFGGEPGRRGEQLVAHRPADRSPAVARQPRPSSGPR